MRRRVFKTRTFARWSRKAGLPDRTLCAAVAEMAAGLVDANLGGNIYKSGTIDEQELTALQMTAEALLDMDVRSLEKAIQAGELTEIRDEEESHTG